MDTGARGTNGRPRLRVGLWRGYLARMASPLDRLERAHREVTEASGADYFRRLRDYEKLLRTKRAIKRQVKRMRKEVKRAEKRFRREDGAFVRELATFRQQFARLAPEADDSGEGRPEVEGHVAPPASADGYEWAYTLANFDAIVTDDESRIFVRRDLDHGKSGMLAAILLSKIQRLRFPEKETAPGVTSRAETDQRPALADLSSAVGEIADKERAAYRKLEDVWETTGLLALHRIESVVAHLGPKDALPMNTEAEKSVAFNAAMKEVSNSLHHLRGVVRPPEVRQPLDAQGTAALEYHERETRKALDRLHRPLRDRLEDAHRVPRWNELGIGEKLTLITFALGIVAAVALAAIFAPS